VTACQPDNGCTSDRCSGQIFPEFRTLQKARRRLLGRYSSCVAPEGGTSSGSGPDMIMFHVEVRPTAL